MATLDGPRWGPREGKAGQLVVLIHGLGADGHDLIDLAPHWGRTLPQAAFVAPDGPEPCDHGFGRQWFSVADRTPARMLAGVSAAAAVLGPFIDAELARLGLGPGDYALMGFSQGAMTVLEAGLCGALPEVGCLLAYSGGMIGADRLGERLAAKPAVLLVHGEADEVVPVAASRAAESALAAAGVPVRALYRPGLGHGLDEVGLAAGAEVLRAVLGQK